MVHGYTVGERCTGKGWWDWDDAVGGHDVLPCLRWAFWNRIGASSLHLPIRACLSFFSSFVERLCTSMRLHWTRELYRMLPQCGMSYPTPLVLFLDMHWHCLFADLSKHPTYPLVVIVLLTAGCQCIWAVVVHCWDADLPFRVGTADGVNGRRVSLCHATWWRVRAVGAQGVGTVHGFCKRPADHFVGHCWQCSISDSCHIVPRWCKQSDWSLLRRFAWRQGA